MIPVSLILLTHFVFFTPTLSEGRKVKLSPPPGKAAQDPNAAWAAYYAQYYGQQPGGAMGGQAPGAAAPAPGDQSQAAQASGGQPDYTKAWEEYYKKMGMST